MERTIRRDGFLFRYAYWFCRKRNRPETVNLCPFFWRVVLISLVAMPAYWLVWVPIGFALGFLFASRPRIFESDGCSLGDSDILMGYQYWPKFKGENIRPIDGTKLLLLALIVVAGARTFGMIHILTVIGVILAFYGSIAIIGGLIIYRPIMRIKQAEWYPMLQDRWDSKKKGICRTYKVV